MGAALFQRIFLPLLVFTLAVSFDAAADATVVPAQPLAFDNVNLRMTVDSCVFNRAATSVVYMNNNGITVKSPRNQCLVPGPTEVVDIELGTFAPGSYVVQVHHNPSDFAPPYERVAFEVRARPESESVPRPLTDYSGLWYNALESGWGLSIHQGADHQVFAVLYVYRGDSQPEWYSIQDGRWTDATTWRGTLYRSSGPGFLGSFNPNMVTLFKRGVAQFEFKQVPGTEGTARLTYFMDDMAFIKSIQRLIQ
jgi:hypothetical protein